MKYMEQGGFQNKPFMRLTLLWMLLFMTGLWLTNFAMYFDRMGLDPATVVSYYNGSEAEFRAPRSAASMLEVAHVHLPIMGIVVLMLTHLLIFAPFSDRFKFSFICSAFLAALLNEGSGWLVRFINPSFAILKVASFLAFQAILGFLLGALALFLLQGMKQHHKRKKTSKGSSKTA